MLGVYHLSLSTLHNCRLARFIAAKLHDSQCITFIIYNILMFNNKINGDFAEEFTSTKQFVKDLEKEMIRKSKLSKIAWVIFSVLIALTNIAVLVVASYALKVVIDDYNMPASKVTFAQILPTALVAALAILMFLLSIVISIYQGLMKSKIYREATEDIQYLTIAFKTKHLKLTDKAFKEKIDKIYVKALKEKTSISLKTTIVSILTGGDNE